jgi:hypothetical protein
MDLVAGVDLEDDERGTPDWFAGLVHTGDACFVPLGPAAAAMPDFLVARKELSKIPVMVRGRAEGGAGLGGGRAGRVVVVVGGGGV